jgi:hypothetical protein
MVVYMVWNSVPVVPAKADVAPSASSRATGATAARRVAVCWVVGR